jgi:hypothetical protein
MQQHLLCCAMSAVRALKMRGGGLSWALAWAAARVWGWRGIFLPPTPPPVRGFFTTTCQETGKTDS